jgi:hypothetical protein
MVTALYQMIEIESKKSETSIFNYAQGYELQRL